MTASPSSRHGRAIFILFVIAGLAGLFFFLRESRSARTASRETRSAPTAASQMPKSADAAKPAANNAARVEEKNDPKREARKKFGNLDLRETLAATAPEQLAALA